MANGSWYYARAGQQQGPVPLETLQQMVAAAQLRPDELVWRDGMTDWAPAGSVQELASAATGAGAYGVNPYVPPAAPGTPTMPYAQHPGVLPYGTTAFIEPAGFWLRFVAWIIDYIVTYIPSALLQLILGAIIGPQGGMTPVPPPPGAPPGTPPTMTAPGPAYFASMGAMMTMGIVIGWLYYALMESSSKQATLGKMALGIIVTDMEGRRISFARATGRFFAKMLSGLTCGIGYIMAAFTERKQAMHDLIASTLVIKKPQ